MPGLEKGWAVRMSSVATTVATLLMMCAAACANSPQRPGGIETQASPGATPLSMTHSVSGSEPTMPVPPSQTPPTTATPPAGPSSAAPSRKKGVSAWSFDGFTAAMTDVRASWFYNWSPRRADLVAPSGVEFVPMIWGGGAVNQSTLDEAKGQGTVLLGFNEPDLAGQANMTVEQALDLWPQLQAVGMRLGSPAPAYGAATPGSWFDRFMAGAAQRGYRVDFIALHWYGSDFSASAVGHLRGYLEAVYDRYRKPIWLTEYALINFSGSPQFPTGEQQAAFARSSVAMLESLSFVERYAWFALPATPGMGTGLYVNGHTPTAAGSAYRSAV